MVTASSSNAWPIHVKAALVPALAGSVAAWLFGDDFLAWARRRGGHFSDDIAITSLFIALLAVVFFGTLLLGRVLASRETASRMKIIALLLYGVGTVLVAVAIFVARCAFHIG